MAPTADELNRRGVELGLQGDVDGARFHYQAALLVDPGFLPAFANYAASVGNNWDREKKETAVVMLQKVCEIAPNDGQQWNNLGLILMQLERYEEAEAAMLQAAKVVPDSITTWHNLALLYLRTHRNREALEFLDKVEELGFTSASIHNDRAHGLLALGSLGAALAQYEHRWSQLQHLDAWDYHIPEWQGEGLVGRSILIHSEQGFGDTLMTTRFTQKLREMGARVTLALHSGMLRLYELQPEPFDVVDSLNLPDDSFERYDFHSPLYSMMRWLGIEREHITGEPYMVAPQVSTPPVPVGGLRVGICWASGTRGGELDWRKRVSDLRDWLVLAAIPRVRLFSLQKGPEESDIDRYGAHCLIQDDTRKLSDWADTAAYINKLDLIVTVDTAVAHLAGCTGKPVIMVSQYSNCWRWWDIKNGTGKPWYDSMEIVSARVPGDWKWQLEQVAKKIRDLIAVDAKQSAAA